MTTQTQTETPKYDLIFQNITLTVNGQGKIRGLKGEGTNAIVLSGKDATVENLPIAIRIPRLLKFDELLNFHLAEISCNQALISRQIDQGQGVYGATAILNLSVYDAQLKIPGTENSDCFLGFYFSPKEKYKVIVVSKERIWPHYEGLKEKNPAELYNFLRENLQKDKSSNIYFLPDSAEKTSDKLKEKQQLDFIKLNRNLLDSIYKSRNTVGWWFNLPVTVHKWMFADLERILTDLKTSSLFMWKLRDWFELAKFLAQGLENIHNKSCIHGDIRPANIMTYSKENFIPNTFGWIDIGLGGINHDSQVPAPLGGGRDSPFYAPERRENLEFEDADVVNLEADRDEIKLTFKWWKYRIPGEKSEALSLESRELSKLKCNDRIQIREFVLVVKEVNVSEGYILISEIYEVISDNVLINREEQKNEIIALLQNASISRYRIYKHWGQATDIYGFGCIVLHLFFMRGLSLHTPDLSFEKDKMFISIINILSSSTFLKTFWDFVSESRQDKGKLQFAELLNDNYFIQSNSGDLQKKYSDIVEYLESIDSGFTVLLRGFNNHIVLCVITLLFCLRCIWRMEDINNLKYKDKEDLSNLNCYSERRDYCTENAAAAAARAYKDVEAIQQAVIKYGWVEEINNHSTSPQAAELQQLEGGADKGRAVALIKKLNTIRKEKDAEIDTLKTEKDAEINQLRTEKDAEINRLRTEKDAEINRLNEKIAELKGKIKNAQIKIENRGAVYYAPTIIKEIEQALK